MNTLIKLLKAEPAVILSLTAAAVSLVAGFGFHLSTEQVGTITGVAEVAVGLLTRSAVTPTVKLKVGGDPSQQSVH